MATMISTGRKPRYSRATWPRSRRARRAYGVSVTGVLLDRARVSRHLEGEGGRAREEDRHVQPHVGGDDAAAPAAVHRRSAAPRAGQLVQSGFLAGAAAGARCGGG